VTPLQERQIEFCGYFLKAGYPPKSAAAIGGNATRENLCLPTTIGAKDHGSDGVLQWRKERLIELQAMTDWQTLKTQAAFTIIELQRDYKVLEFDLRNGTKTLPTLTLDFCDVFERPSADGRVADARIKAADDCLKLIEPRPIDQAAQAIPLPAPAAQQSIIPIIPPSPITFTKGTPSMPPFDPILAAKLVEVFAPLVESLISGLIKAIVTHAGQPGGLPKLPIDPSVIEKLVADAIAKQQKGV
jgi:hypothetical protein